MQGLFNSDEWIYLLTGSYQQDDAPGHPDTSPCSGLTTLQDVAQNADLDRVTMVTDSIPAVRRFNYIGQTALFAALSLVCDVKGKTGIKNPLISPFFVRVLGFIFDFNDPKTGF